MDLRDFYRLIAAQEAAIEAPFVLIVSSKTPNGGREGVMTEVARGTAARMIVQGIARLARPEEVAAQREAHQQAERQKQLDTLQERLRLASLAKDELKAIRLALGKTGKEK